MTHLYIELNTSGIEEVNASIIAKLYELAISGDLDETSDLKGRLHSSTAREKHVTYLNNNFDDLYISADIQYLSFDDPDVEDLMKRYIGTSDGVSLLDVQTFVNSGTAFGSGYTNTHTNRRGDFCINNEEKASINTFDEINLFNGLTSLGDNVFNLSNLTSIQLPSSITTFGAGIFGNCTSLTSVTGLSNIISIPERMFYEDSSLSDVDIDFSKITTLGQSCFFRTGLTGIINLPNLTTLGHDAFSECTGITEVNIGANVSNENKIRSLDYTFHLCTSLKKVTGLSQVTEIRNAFKDCTNLEYIDTTSNLTSLTNNTGNCFLNCKKLKCIDVSNVSIIPAHCFRECSSLLSLSTSDPSNTNSNEETFTINDTVIRDSSFARSYLNNKILYYPNATSMEGWSHAVSSIKGFRAPNVITIGGENSFSSCGSLVSVELGNVTSIAGNTFSNCNNLVDIKFGTSPITYNSQDLCVDIENSSILTVGHHAFANTTSLFTSKTVEYTEEANGQTQTNSFTGRVKLKLLNCTSIGNGSFENSRVSEVYAPSTTFIDGHSFKASHIQKITIGNVTAINEFSFANCTNLTTINFPSTLTSIKLNALSNTSLGVVDLPSSIEEILNQAFAQCSSIPYFILRSTTPPTLGDGFAFPNLFSNGNVVRKIYVPDGSLSAYLTAWANVKLWNDYIVDALDVISNIPLS